MIPTDGKMGSRDVHVLRHNNYSIQFLDHVFALSYKHAVNKEHSVVILDGLISQYRLYIVSLVEDWSTVG